MQFALFCRGNDAVVPTALQGSSQDRLLPTDAVTDFSNTPAEDAYI